METQTELEARILDAQKRQGPMAGPILLILQSQDRMEANIATLAAAMKPIKAAFEAATIEPKTPIARFFWRLKV